MSTNARPGLRADGVSLKPMLITSASAMPRRSDRLRRGCVTRQPIVEPLLRASLTARRVRHASDRCSASYCPATTCRVAPGRTTLWRGHSVDNAARPAATRTVGSKARAELSRSIGRSNDSPADDHQRQYCPRRPEFHPHLIPTTPMPQSDHLREGWVRGRFGCWPPMLVGRRCRDYGTRGRASRSCWG